MFLRVIRFDDRIAGFCKTRGSVTIVNVEWHFVNFNLSFQSLDYSLLHLPPEELRLGCIEA
jgi:hypothetical protein